MTWLTSALDQRDLRRRGFPARSWFSQSHAVARCGRICVAGRSRARWPWLVASGIGSFLPPALPCLGMAALHLCSRGNASGCDRRKASAPNRTAAALTTDARHPPERQQHEDHRSHPARIDCVLGGFRRRPGGRNVHAAEDTDGNQSTHDGQRLIRHAGNDGHNESNAADDEIQQRASRQAECTETKRPSRLKQPPSDHHVNG